MCWMRSGGVAGWMDAVGGEWKRGFGFETVLEDKIRRDGLTILKTKDNFSLSGFRKGFFRNFLPTIL